MRNCGTAILTEPNRCLPKRGLASNFAVTVYILTDCARLKPLSETAVIKFLSSLSLLRSVTLLLLSYVEVVCGSAPHDSTPIRYDDNTPATTARICGHAIVLGLASLVLPFYRELELRGEQGESLACERMRLFRMQAHQIAILTLRELARAIRYLPSLHYTRLNWRMIYPWAEFCSENVFEDMADVETCVVLIIILVLVLLIGAVMSRITNEVKLMGYALDVISTPQATALIERLDGYLGKPTPQQPNSGSPAACIAPMEDFLNSTELADLFLPVEYPWIGAPKEDSGIMFGSSDFHFNQFADG
ncbi:hypothetical protein K438DRAFT_1957315 [Mycena galopus ATCC 62051]|nr:hypothetical protein K438DRAFT_1957315 [Mycena galopus ATCC 62051]